VGVWPVLGKLFEPGGFCKMFLGSIIEDTSGLGVSCGAGVIPGVAICMDKAVDGMVFFCDG